MGIGFEEKKRMVKQAYPSPMWEVKVEMMPKYQILAIYDSLKTRGKLKYAKDIKKEGYIYHQITFDEVLNKEN